MGYAGHYDHFLERLSRIDDEQVDFAMSLYYDPQFVRTFLANYDIPDEYERVAVAIDEGPDSPHIVLARDGGFVTCLGQGMQPNGLFVIPREKVESLHGLRKEVGRCMEQLEDWRGGSLNATIRRKSSTLDRQDFARLAALQPLLMTRAVGSLRRRARQLWDARQQLEVRLGRKVRRLTRRQEKFVKRYWQDFFLMNISSVLLAMGVEYIATQFDDDLFARGFGDLPLWSWREEMLGPCLRAMWCAGRMGEFIGDYLLDRLADADDSTEIYACAFGLVTIALRHQRFYEPVVEHLRSWRDGFGAMPEAELTLKQQFQQSIGRLVLPALEETQVSEETFTVLTQMLYRHMLERDPQLEETLGKPDELSATDALGLLSAQISAINSEDGAMMMLVHAAPVLARAAAADLFPPRCIVADVPSWDPAYGVFLFHNHTNRFGAPEPVTAEETPGRNDPCNCGSGRKYKRCCLRA